MYSREKNLKTSLSLNTVYFHRERIYRNTRIYQNWGKNAPKPYNVVQTQSYIKLCLYKAIVPVPWNITRVYFIYNKFMMTPCYSTFATI